MPTLNEIVKNRNSKFVKKKYRAWDLSGSGESGDVSGDKQGTNRGQLENDKRTIGVQIENTQGTMRVQTEDNRGTNREQSGGFSGNNRGTTRGQ